MAFITPAVSVTPTVENWMRSQQVTESLLNQPEVYPELTKRYGEQDYSIQGLTTTLGGKSIINNMVFRHAEENFLNEVLQFETYGGGGGAGAIATLTIAAAYDYTYPASAPVAPYLSTSQTTALVPMPNQIIMFPDRSTAIVTKSGVSGGLAANQIAVYPRGGGVVPAIATTDIVVILGNQTPEFSLYNSSRDTQLIWYTNNMGNSNGSYSISGNAKQEKIWVKQGGVDKWFMPAQLNERKRLKNEREVLFVTNDFTTNLTYANATTTMLNGVVQSNATNISFQGMIPWLNAYSNQFPYNNVSFLTEQLWQDFISLTLVPNYASANYALYASTNVINYNSTWIRSEMKNGAWKYGMQSGDKSWVNFNFDAFSISGRTFGQKNYDLLDAPKLLGGIPYFKSYAMGIPMDSSEHTVDWDNMTTTKMLPQFVVHYQEGREWHEFYTGGNAPAENYPIDSLTINFDWTSGIEMFRPNAWFQVFNSGL